MQKLTAVIKQGAENKLLQRTPHLVLLDRAFYMSGTNTIYRLIRSY